MDDFVEGCLAAIVITVVAVLILTWPVMILFGVLASLVGVPALAISFKATIVVVLLGRLLTASASN